MNAAELTTTELVKRLRAWAEGYQPAVAAVELLIAHGTWLQKDAFLDCVEIADSTVSGTPMAAVDWSQLSANPGPCSSGEHAVMVIAASLGGSAAVELGSALTSVDRVNVL
ncbi:MAG: hypothetical protein L0I24_20735, partial [Pseudonocardia sp.]|nr:hypothetical protein [Pseudonocardia sp.]